MSARDGTTDAAQADRAPGGERSVGRCLMAVLWPSFVVAAAGVGIVFSLVDPHELAMVHLYLSDSRDAAYSLGFLLLWALCAASSGFTWWFACARRASG